MARKLDNTPPPDNTNRITIEDILKYQSLMPLLEAMYKEFQTLSKSKSEATLSRKKVEIVNRLLTEVLALLDGQPSRPFLELLDEEALPQNSDVVLMLGQVVVAMKSFSSRYHETVNYNSQWAIKK